MPSLLCQRTLGAIFRCAASLSIHRDSGSFHNDPLQQHLVTRFHVGCVPLLLLIEYRRDITTKSEILTKLVHARGEVSEMQGT